VEPKDPENKCDKSSLVLETEGLRREAVVEPLFGESEPADQEGDPEITEEALKASKPPKDPDSEEE